MTLSDITALKGYLTDKVRYKFYINTGFGGMYIHVRPNELEDLISEFRLSDIKEVFACANDDGSITYRIYLEELYRS